MAILAILLEIRAVKLPYFGFFSVSFPFYVLLALHPDLSTPLAVLALAIGLFLRAAVHRESSEVPVDEMVSDAVCILGSILLEIHTLPTSGVISAVSYCILGFIVPRVIAIRHMGGHNWLELQRQLIPLYLGVALLTPALQILSKTSLWTGLWLIPFTWTALAGAQALVDRASDPDADVPKRSRVLRATLKETQQDLQHTATERDVLEDLVRSFAAAPDLNATMEHSLSVVISLIRCDSAVFFLEHKGDLRTALGKTKDQERLASAELLKLVEPVVWDCWERRKLVLAQDRHQVEGRIFEREKAAVALPLRGIGVLYVGRLAASKFSREELKLLALITDQTIPAIRAARRYTQLQAALKETADANQKLLQADQQKSFLLEGFDQMATSLDPSTLLEFLQQLLAKLFPEHQAGLVVLDSETQRCWPNQQLILAATDLVLAVQSKRRPLLLESGGSPLMAPGSFESVLAVPLTQEGDESGAVILAAKEPEVFNAQDLELLKTVVFHLAAVLDNSRLFAELRASQTQLVQSSKLAAVGQLAAGVAHELNTPLGSIMVGIDSVLASVPEGRAHKRLSKCLEQVERARGIVEKLLYYSRQAGQAHKLVSPQEILVDSLELLGNQLSHSGVRVEGDFHGAPQVRANSNELQQVFFNLLLNARDALSEVPPERRRIVVRAQVTSNTCSLEFRDHGPGVPPEAQARLFEPFFTTKEVGKGTGLGLSISRQIIEAHDGVLEHFTPEDGGCGFVIRLPLSTE